MTVHRLKTINPYFEEIRQGVKKFEVRLNDRDFNVDDEVYLQEYDPETNKYSGIEIRADIIYVLKDYEAIKKGYVVFGFRVKQHIIKNPHWV